MKKRKAKIGGPGKKESEFPQIVKRGGGGFKGVPKFENPEKVGGKSAREIGCEDYIDTNPGLKRGGAGARKTATYLTLKGRTERGGSIEQQNKAPQESAGWARAKLREKKKQSDFRDPGIAKLPYERAWRVKEKTRI